MALPTSKAEFIEYCLRRLGKPVINIEIASQQLDDRVDDCLQLWKEFHYDASRRQYLKHQITQEEIDQGYIEMPRAIKNVVRVSAIDWGVSTGIFSMRYQLSLNDLWDLSSTTLGHYVIANQYVETIEDVLVPESNITFQHVTGQLRFSADMMSRFFVNQWVIIECWVEVDPETYPNIWNDRIMLDVGTAMIKKQWGSNIKKYESIQLPGGSTIKGQQIFDEAEAELAQLRLDMRALYETPPSWEWT